MSRSMILALVVAGGMMSAVRAGAGENPLAAVKWQQGPSTGELGSVAEIQVPAGHVFAGGGDTRIIMEAMQNPTDGTELGMIGPVSLDWFAVFEYDACGYVRDDEKDKLDADAMLQSIRTGTEASNRERSKRGWPTMSIVGWEQKPCYNAATHNLEWAIRGQSEGHFVVNHNTRLLGRGGVMRVTLVADPAALGGALPRFQDVLAGFVFKTGQKYAEYRQGDKMAKYGLAALVVGGATAAAVKTGLFKWLWKLIVVAVIGAGAVVRRLFGGKKPPEVQP
ncbi:MAG: DUF2167 domain-containing protein [Planctomycetota bacterium]